MAHRNDCPTEWEARREGERAAGNGYGRNPYRDECEDAERAWDRGYRNMQERREEEEMQRRHEEERERQRIEEDYYRQQEEYEQMCQPQVNQPPSPPCEKCGELCDCIPF